MSKDTYLQDLETIVTGVIAPQAAETDRDGKFPQAAIDALGKAGLLGLISAPAVGGMGLGLREAALVTERIARECGSTAMIVCMHYSGVMVIEKFGDEATRKAVAAGKHLSTLAFSEAGSRSQFWAPVSTAKKSGGNVTFTGMKSFCTSATHATAYVWSSKPAAAEGASTLWLVPRTTSGLRHGKPFDGMGLRGNDSSPITAEGATVPESAMLGADGAGLQIMLEQVLPAFNLMSASISVGFMESATSRAIAHVSGTGFEHDGTKLRDLPTIRAYVARMRIDTDRNRLLVADTAEALMTGRADAMLRVLECKAAAGEAASTVTDLALRVCGGAAFRKDLAIDRVFRDSKAAGVMAPTTDHLYEFLGRAITGLPVF